MSCPSLRPNNVNPFLFMAEIVVKVDLPSEFKREFEIALAKVVEQFVRDSTLLALKERLESKEEKELIEWSVKLGRNAKKGRFKRLLGEVSPNIRKKLAK